MIKQTQTQSQNPKQMFLEYFKSTLLPEFKELTDIYQQVKATSDPKIVSELLMKVDACMEKFEEPPTFGEPSNEKPREDITPEDFLSKLKMANGDD